MITAEEKCPDWSDWKPQWTAAKQTPHDFQENHAPSARQPDDTQRRIVDARLWDGLAPLQQEAALLIACSFDMIGGRANYKLSNWKRLPGSTGTLHISDSRARLINIYFDWGRKCTERNISHAMIVDILCFGLPCRLIDRDRRLKNGSAKINLLRGLSLYCEMRGWV